jgi:hypothetical protein
MRLNERLTLAQVKEARRRARRGENMKAVAQSMNWSYGPIRCAILGITWSTISDPPPLTKHEINERWQRPWRVCCNCGLSYRVGGTTERCGACYAYWRKYGSEREERFLQKGLHARLSRADVAELYEEYLIVGSVEKVAAGKPFSAETLRRRFHQDGYQLNTSVGLRQRLTAAIVRQARQRYYDEGVRISDMANELGVHYQTLHSAVIGATWRHVGGLPFQADEKAWHCSNCSILTSHHSRLCAYCRQSE